MVRHARCSVQGGAVDGARGHEVSLAPYTAHAERVIADAGAVDALASVGAIGAEHAG